MSYILMAEQEEGSEVRISEFDPGPRGFNTACEAGRFIHKARERYPESRRIWVEMLRDSDYWRDYFAQRHAQGVDDYPEDFPEEA
jgi:hypothetical protein